MDQQERIRHALRETEILKAPAKLISTSSKTTLHYYVLSEPYYLEAFSNHRPETRIREGKIIWDVPRLLTPGYVLNTEGFSEEAKRAFHILAKQYPDMAGILYKMNYKKESLKSITVAKSVEATFDRIKDELKDKDDTLTAVIKGVDDLWDVSLMKLVQQLMIKSAYKSQFPYYEERGFLVTENGYPMVTRNLEGLPIAAQEEIERMFREVENGDLDPAKLKQELDRWGVFKAYEDRFFDLFRKG